MSTIFHILHLYSLCNRYSIEQDFRLLTNDRHFTSSPSAVESCDSNFHIFKVWSIAWWDCASSDSFIHLVSHVLFVSNKPLKCLNNIHSAAGGSSLKLRAENLELTLNERTSRLFAACHLSKYDQQLRFSGCHQAVQ